MSRAVIDQPGLRVFLIGLALSLFLGLAIRSQISDARVQQYLSKTVDRLQTDFFVDYESAQVHLSNWGLPLPYLSVTNIRLSPKNNLCQSSQIHVDELEVPISFLTVVGLSKTIPKIRIRQMELRLSDIEKCTAEGGLSQSPVRQTAAEEKPRDVQIKNVFSNKSRAELKEIFVEKLKIISSKKPDQPLLLKQVNIDLGYADNRLSDVGLHSKVSALKDTRSDVYFLNANLVASFKSSDSGEIEILTNLTGKLLDGDVKLFTHGFAGAKKISYELAVDQVSARALSPFLDSFSQNPDMHLNPLFEKAAVSVSFSNKGEIYLGENVSAESKIQKLQINIESGALKINELGLKYADHKVKVDPFELNIEAVSLSKIKNLEAFRKKLDSFESLGELTGVLEFKNEDSYRIKGNIRNIQAVFSNRGRRDLQLVDYMDIDVVRSLKELRLKAENFIIGSEKVSGRLEAAYNTETLSTEAQLKLSGSVLGSKIWEQFTFVEQTPKVELLWTFKKQETETHTLKLLADRLLLPGVKMEGLSLDLLQSFSAEQGKPFLTVNLKPTRLTTDESFFDNAVVAQVLASGRVAPMTSTKTSLLVMGSDWKDLNFNLDSIFQNDGVRGDSHLSFKGSVKFRVGLNGRLTLQHKNFSSRFDLLTGSDEQITVKQVQ